MTEASAAVTGTSPAPEARLLQAPAAVVPFVVGAVAVAVATLPLDRAIVAAFAAGVLVVLSAIDLERGIIPNRIVLPAAGIILTAQVVLFPGQASEWLLAAILASLALMIPQLLRRTWMGMGDVKLALLLGATLGWGVIAAVFLAFICVFPVALLLLIRDGGAARKAMIPFGPFLSLGALIVLFGPHLAGLPTS
ncbi:MAG: prepilin peptidase [Solirubrobacterales bacterium]|nr:prepilin peptidase [Solirubrobacterales bacterium]